ncbi:MAG: fused chorismate mutase/prephenate dehydrogenase [Candidatus Westeberhardia cardiocondylae]|nr:fused chorismate mutase/prephenate dehydrogenase [Candidatus Westeberhardia cardiocondylae]
MTLKEDLKTLREKINNTDKSLMNLIHERLLIVTKIGILKKQHGLPIYDPKREQKLINNKKKYAKILNISKNFIENIFYNIIKESYKIEENIGFKTLNKNIGPIVIIGGHGNMGSFFEKMLSLSGYEIILFGRKDWENSNTILKNTKLIVISVPIHSTIKVIKQLPTLKNDCILVDVTSIKHEPIQTMLKIHDGPVLGLHPIFNPKSNDTASRKTMIYCHGRQQKSYQWILDQIQMWGITLYNMETIEHDKYMLLSQSLRHFIYFTYGIFLEEKNIDIKKLFKMSPPIYQIELTMIGRLFSQDPELCFDIITSQPEISFLVDAYQKCLKKTIKLVNKNKEKKTFFKYFKKTKFSLGEYTEQLKINSDNILNNLNLHKNK